MREAKRLKARQSFADDPVNTQELQSLVPNPEDLVPQHGVTEDLSISFEDNLGDLNVSDTSHTVDKEEVCLEEDDKLEEEEEYSNVQKVFNEWILSLSRNQRRMLSVLLYESFRNRQGMNKMAAARESASITGWYNMCVFS